MSDLGIAKLEDMPRYAVLISLAQIESEDFYKKPGYCFQN